MGANRMSPEMRSTRCSVLSLLIPDYVERAMGDGGEEVFYVSFPQPRVHQRATIDVATGQVIRYVRQQGSQHGEVADPNQFVGTIDRRIQYLWANVRHLTNTLPHNDSISVS